MTDLERRALLGDHEAQQECTKKRIVLPCPFCGGKAMIEYDDIMPFEYSVFCEDCNVMPSVSEDKQVVISVWNTRPAPPIGRCKDCEHYTLLGHCKIHSQEPDEHGPGAYVEMLPDDFCSYFDPKERRQ